MTVIKEILCLREKWENNFGDWNLVLEKLNCHMTLVSIKLCYKRNKMDIFI